MTTEKFVRWWPPVGLVMMALLGWIVGKSSTPVDDVFQHHAAEETEHEIAIGYAKGLSPRAVAPCRVESCVIHTPRPDRGRTNDLLCSQTINDDLRRRNNGITAIVEAAQHRHHRRFQKAQAIISRICLEQRVERRHHRKTGVMRHADRAVTQYVGRRDVENVRREGDDVIAH